MKQKMYLHSDKADNYYHGEEWGLTGNALIEFRWALSEVQFDVDIDEETGEVTIERAIYGKQVLVPEDKNDR